jgi:hypothetical protein
VKLVLAWEALPGQAQIGIAYPVLTALLFLLHLGPLDQPVGRAIFYGLFWAVPATALLVIGTRNEASKRRGERPQDPGDGATE